MKRMLVEAYLERNFGDDLFLYILFNRYKDKDVKWTLKVHDKAYVDMFKEFKNVEVIVKYKLSKVMLRNKMLRRNMFKKEAQDNDGLVIIGGSMFIQNKHWRELMDRYLDKTEIFKDKNVFILGANFGPYETEEFLEQGKEVFKRCKDVCFRDKYSYDLFKELKSVRMASDIVFNLECETKNKKNIIGLSLIGIDEKEEFKKYKEDYKKKFVELVDKITEKSTEVYMFAFCKMQGDTGISNEILEDVLNKDKVKLIEYNGDVEYFLGKLGEVKGVVGTRFHSIILSQVLNQNIYPIIYSNKSLNILNDLGISEKYTEVKEIKYMDCKEVLESLENNRVDNMKSVVEKAKEQFSKLDKYLDGIG